MKQSARQAVSRTGGLSAGRKARRAPGKTRPLAALGQLLTIDSVLRLQRDAGNAAVCALLDRSRPPVQRNGGPAAAGPAGGPPQGQPPITGPPTEVRKVKPQVQKEAKPVDRLIGGEDYELAVETTPPGLDLKDLPELTWKVTGPAKIAGGKSLQTDDVADPDSVVVSLTAAGDTEELTLPIEPIESVVKVTPTLEPFQDVPGRPQRTFGVGEEAFLRYVLEPAVGPQRLGGLIWEAQGPAVVPQAALNPAMLTAKRTPGADVTLNLKIRAGRSAGRLMSTETIRVIPPTGVAMERKAGTGVHHVKGTASAGFVGNWFFQPANVSFHNLEFKEEACGSAMSGCFSRKQWAKDGHKANPRWAKTVSDVDGRGTPISGTDTVYSGQFVPIRTHRPYASLGERLRGLGAPVKAPYKPGDFEPGFLDWNIPVSYQIAGTADAVPFGHELQHMECSDVGDMRVSKLKVEVETSADDPDVILSQIGRGHAIVRAIPGLPPPPPPP